MRAVLDQRSAEQRGGSWFESVHFFVEEASVLNNTTTLFLKEESYKNTTSFLKERRYI